MAGEGGILLGEIGHGLEDVDDFGDVFCLLAEFVDAVGLEFQEFVGEGLHILGQDTAPVLEAGGSVFELAQAIIEAGDPGSEGGYALTLELGEAI